MSSPLWRFLLVGVTNAVVSYSVFRIGLALDAGAAVAQAVAYAAGILWSFVWNRRWSFRHRGRAGSTLVRFTVLQLTLLAASSTLIGLAVDRFGLPATPSWLSVMAFVTAANYVALRRLVFVRPVGEPKTRSGPGQRHRMMP